MVSLPIPISVCSILVCPNNRIITHSYQCVQYFSVSQQWYGCQRVGDFVLLYSFSTCGLLVFTSAGKSAALCCHFVLQGAFGKLFIKFNIMWCRYRKFSSLGNYPILEVSSSVCCVCDASPDFIFSQKVHQILTYGLKVLRGYPSFYCMDH